MVISFLEMAARGEVKTAYDRFIAPRFLHHNQYFKGDRASLMNAMEEGHKASPNKSLKVKQIFEDGDTVITHSLVTRKNAGELPIAVVHFFRFKNKKIVELWDLGQELHKNSPNKNGAF